MILVNELKGKIKVKEYTLEQVSWKLGITCKTLSNELKLKVMVLDASRYGEYTADIRELEADI